MNRIWTYISNLGTAKSNHYLDKKTIVLTNQLNFLMAMSMVFLLTVLVLYWLVSDYELSLGTLRVVNLAVLSILIMILAGSGFTVLSWLTLIFLPPVVFILGPTLIGYVEEESYFYYPYVLISASIIPQLLINPKKQKVLFWLSILYYFFLTVMIYNVMIIFGDNTFDGEQYAIMDVIKSSLVFYIVSQISVFLFVNVGIYYLRMINFRSEEELNMKNRELDSQNAELKKQKGEIEKHKDDLLQKEISTWQKLVNIISHEIVNSAIPITNLAGMSRQMLEDESGHILKPEMIGEEVSTDIHHSLRVIETRTQALINLVTATKNLTHIPLPAKRKFFIKDLFERILLLYKANFREKGIEFETLVYPPGLCIDADLELIEQVIINLIKNSLEALDGIEQPEISLTAALDTGHVRISVADNGAGISEDVIGQIFIPYFSTKNGNSGIGLSLSRKIMMLHNGRLEVSSTIHKGSSFSLIFPL